MSYDTVLKYYSANTLHLFTGQTYDKAYAHLSSLLNGSPHMLCINGRSYVIRRSQIPTQCGGEWMLLLPVSTDNAHVVMGNVGDPDRLRPIEADPREYRVDDPIDKWECDIPLREYDRGMWHIDMRAAHPQDVDALASLIKQATEDLRERTNGCRLYCAGAYQQVMDNSKQTIENSIPASDERAVEGHYYGYHRYTIQFSTLDVQESAFFAIHLDRHHVYEDPDYNDCEYCDGTGILMDEVWDDVYEEWIEQENECQECCEHACDEDDDYIRWCDRLEHDFETQLADPTWTVGLTPVDIGEARARISRPDSIPDPTDDCSTFYLCNWEGNRGADTTVAEQVLSTGVEMLEIIEACERTAAFSLTCNMGEPCVYSQTPRAMEYLHTQADMFKGFTMVLPEGEATNPNERFHYIHSLTFVRTPDDWLMRTGHIDLSYDYYPVQGRLGEVA